MATIPNFSPVAKPYGTDDIVLGGVGRLIPKSPTLDRLSKLINSYSGREYVYHTAVFTCSLLTTAVVVYSKLFVVRSAPQRAV